MVARIYKPQKTAMQSGMAQTKKWVLELEHDMAKSIEPLMGCLLYTSDAADE